MDYNRMMSMSMFLEKRHKPEKEIHIPKPSPSIWIPSQNVSKCYKCRSEFGMWKRKHHCRVCGRVFCANCADKWGVIPSLVNSTTPPIRGNSVTSWLKYDESQKRMCEKCKNKTDFIHESSNYIYIFTNLPIELKDLYELRLVNKLWCKSVNTILSAYKSVQYNLPIQKFSKMERSILWTHRNEFVNHFQLMSKCLSCFKFGEKNNNNLEKLIKLYDKKIQTNKCNDLACRRTCSPSPNIEEILEMYNNSDLLKNTAARMWLSRQLKRVHIYELKLIMPWLVGICIKNHDIAYETLIPLCVNELQLAYSFYFELNFYTLDTFHKQRLSNIKKKFLNVISKEVKYELEKTELFIEFINDVICLSSSFEVWNEKSTKWFAVHKYVLMPWDVNIKCVGIQGEGISIFNSATKPWKIPFIVKKSGKDKIMNILVKFEDVRKDKLTMVVAEYLKKICMTYVDIDLYSVFPINTTMGWIEMVEQSNTLYDIKYKFKSTLQNYIMDLNPNATVSQIREKFIKTCVSSCVLCYVLGVGDRHMENILVTRQGKLLHIDFSYILGDDPKHLKVEMKITEDMLQMLGGQNSESFKMFKKYCKEAYKLLRQRSSLWYILLTYLEFSVPSIDKFKYNSETIRNHVIERLIPGESDIEASMQIIDIVERSSYTTWGQNLSDWSHTIGNSMRNLKTTIFNGETQFNMDL